MVPSVTILNQIHIKTTFCNVFQATSRFSYWAGIFNIQSCQIIRAERGWVRFSTSELPGFCEIGICGYRICLLSWGPFPVCWDLEWLVEACFLKSHWESPPECLIYWPQILAKGGLVVSCAAWHFNCGISSKIQFILATYRLCDLG